MTNVDSETTEAALVRDYLGRLQAAGWGLDPARRTELVAEVAEHIDEATRAERASGNRGEAVVRDVLDRLGRPEEIVRVALEEEKPERLRPSLPTQDGTNLKDIATVLLLMFGGALWYVGWFAGAGLLWSSPRWRSRDKWLATLVWPFGYAGVIALISSSWWSSATVQTCTSTSARPGIPGHETCIGGWPGWLTLVLLAAALFSQVLVAVHLLRTSRRLVAAAPH